MRLINIAQAGVISDSPGISHIGMNILFFLLSSFGVVAIIMVVVYGMMYFFSFGDERKMITAKKSAINWTIGIIVAMSSMVLINFLGQMLK